MARIKRATRKSSTSSRLKLKPVQSRSSIKAPVRTESIEYGKPIQSPNGSIVLVNNPCGSIVLVKNPCGCSGFIPICDCPKHGHPGVECTSDCPSPPRLDTTNKSIILGSCIYRFGRDIDGSCIYRIGRDIDFKHRGEWIVAAIDPSTQPISPDVILNLGGGELMTVSRSDEDIFAQLGTHTKADDDTNLDLIKFGDNTWYIGGKLDFLMADQKWNACTIDRIRDRFIEMTTSFGVGFIVSLEFTSSWRFQMLHTHTHAASTPPSSPTPVRKRKESEVELLRQQYASWAELEVEDDFSPCRKCGDNLSEDGLCSGCQVKPPLRRQKHIGKTPEQLDALYLQYEKEDELAESGSCRECGESDVLKDGLCTECFGVESDEEDAKEANPETWS